MTRNRYQILEKALYIKLVVLEDEMTFVDELLRQDVSGVSDIARRYRATRQAFLVLNNVRDAILEVRIREPDHLVRAGRTLRKRLDFANHFRNKGIGHLDLVLLERAVQWHPHIFHEDRIEDQAFQSMEAQKAIIEACANSHVSSDGMQKSFGTEIDLLYQPDVELFYKTLHEIMGEAFVWLREAAAHLRSGIKYHADSDVVEMGAVAGLTNFNLNEESDLAPSAEDAEKSLSLLSRVLDDSGIDGATRKTIERRFSEYGLELLAKSREVDGNK